MTDQEIAEVKEAAAWWAVRAAAARAEADAAADDPSAEWRETCERVAVGAGESAAWWAARAARAAGGAR